MSAIVKNLSALSVAAALVVTAGIASATEYEASGRTVDVRHGDLDLSRAADQARLKARIARAAARTCDQYQGGAAAKCQRLTVAQVRQPMEAAFARASTTERFADASKVAAVAPAK